MSLNDLNNPYTFPYSLNGLQIINTSDGGTLPVTALPPMIENTTATNQVVSLYESSPDVIDFSTYDKSLKVKRLIATTGTFESITATGAQFYNLNATAIIAGTGSFINITSTGARFFSLNATGINAGSGSFQNVFTNTLTANTINISSLNIPNLTFTRATGGFVSTTGTISTQQNFRTTNGINTFDFTDISSDGDTSIYNAGGANQTSFRFDGSERMKLSSAGKLDVPFLQCSGAFTGATIATTSTIFSGGTLATFSGNIQNVNSTWTTNSNDMFLNTNNDTIYLRPKGTTATPADAQVFLGTNGSLTCTTGTLTAFNGTFSGGLSATNANINAFALTASGFVRAPYFTGAKIDTNFLTFTTATGGTVRSNIVVRNPQTLQFNQLNDTQIVRIEPAGASNVLSYYDVSNVLQETYTTSSSGANIDFINQMGVRDLTATGRIFNGNGNQTTPSYTFVNDTNTGFYRIGEDNIALSLGNRRNMNFTQGAITMGSGANNGVDLFIQGGLQVGGTSNSSNALINLGFSGSAGAIANYRQGYIYMDGSNMFLNNQQFDNVPLLQNSTKGSIILDPANGTYRFVLRPSGQLTLTSRVDNDASVTFTNFTTGAGYGLFLNKPNDGANGNNYYSLVIQGTNYTPAITMHAQVNNISSNITLGRLNYPNGNESITIRPYSLLNETQYIRICNSYLDNNANGATHVGIYGTGAYTTYRADTFINNYSDNSGGKSSGIRFQTDTNTYTVGSTAQFIDYTGQTFFNPYTQRGVGATNTKANAVLSVGYDFYQSPGIGTTFSLSRGQGAFVPRVLVALTNQTYTVAAGNTKLVGTNSTNVDHSAYYVSASGHQTYSIRADWTGLYQVSANINLFCSTATGFFIYLYYGSSINAQTSVGYIPSGQFTNYSLSKWINVTAGDDIWMTIQADVNTVTVGNYSTWEISYVG